MGMECLDGKTRQFSCIMQLGAVAFTVLAMLRIPNIACRYDSLIAGASLVETIYDKES